ncbi:PQQ-dependent sugar dehydrogenase [Solirubrobacter phytolaccae]|uniref:PQQ-dependent sugar dehydrogenase n=1 Tax=Solirubrobacter phytolaccae TaxID=1404360 RepID=A0A9X3N6A3_9ACTN|nr:LamG-like jellyroll fold domain-containing protein [Solirubrobacter phytolaccae]MDA0180301.1 PQQ-dependent sugar dehydrogenase [Solirubrobacter phytolaccae]
MLLRFAWVVAAALLVFASPAAAAGIDEDPFAPSALAAAADYGDVPDDFVNETVWDDLLAPSSIAFAPDGRVFIAQLDGVIKVFDGPEDVTPTVYADLTENVAWHNDRGLTAITLDPGFTTGRPYLYALYTYDAKIGGTAPLWNDVCPDPPGAERDGCVVSGRLSKILPDGSEHPLITDEWCQQYSSHSVGDLNFGPDGALYVSGGDGASYTFADYGQDGAPVNPCGDPPAAVGGAMTPPSAEGGALRSQDVRTSGDPTGLDGAILRVDPDTGDPLPDNPGTGDKNARRIVSYGFRNPFRFAFRPGTTDTYVGDVGWLAWEELNRIPNITAGVSNYGWPCYEGMGRQGGYEAVGLKLCEDLYASGTARTPLYTYNHDAKVAGESCTVGSSSISGVTFYEGQSFPAAYHGALFFADYARNCIWVMFPNADGTPNPATRQVFVDGAGGPVDLQTGPGGDLYYVDVWQGRVGRVRAVNANQAPTAVFTATPDTGGAPLHVDFDATSSSDPNGDELDYAWDLDGDGAYDDSTSATPGRTYTQEGNVTVRLRVSDPGGLQDTATRLITVGTPPTASIGAPAAGAREYAVGETVNFSGSATRADGTPVPASQLQWTVDLNHCSAIVPTSCHVHHIQNYAGISSGSFTYPDHEYPSYITLGLTATVPSSGLQGRSSVRIDPKTVELSFNSVPSGLVIGVGGEASTTPFTRRVAQGSTVGVAAPLAQNGAGSSYEFASWAHGGAAAQQFTAPTAGGTYTARYTEAVCPVLPGLVGAWGFDEASGTVAFDASGRGNPGTISGATRTASGRFGAALSFDGSNDLVTVADSASLDLAAGMTLEGWVNPTQLGDFRTVLMKEHGGTLAYALYADGDGGLSSGHVSTPFDQRANGSPLAAGVWSHLAATYDGAILRMYVNGDEISAEPVGGDISVGTGALRIGGNTVWSEWFSGRLDDLRVYDRALSGTEVRVDMTRPVTCVGNPQTPALSVAPASLSFDAQQGGAAPAAKSLELANTGAGTLNWSVAEDAPWLHVAPASGTGAANVAVDVDPTGLAAGTHTTNVTVNATGAANAPRVVPVTFTVAPAPPGPRLGVSPSTVHFTTTAGESAPAAKTLAVENLGGGTLTWSAASDAGWLAVAPGSGSGNGTITLTPSTSGLAVGTHTATVTVSAPGASDAPRTVEVSVTVEPPAAPPVLATAPTSLAFSATEGAATVETKAINVTNTGGGTLSFSASADVPWLTVTPSADTAPRTVSVRPSTAGLAPGVHAGVVTIVSAGVSGSPRTIPVTFTITAAPTCTTPSGLAGAWGFDEASGATAQDATPAGNAGAITGATRVASGRFGGALSFDGVNDWVTVADAPAVRLTTGMTLSAWINPATAGAAWRTVAMKERSGGLSYTLYSNTDSGQPSGHVSTPFESNARSGAALPAGVWTYLSTTYDGTTLRLFSNGVQVASRAVSGPITNDGGALRIGGNAVWSEWFGGLIDEVRLYNRALTATELQADMAKPVTCSGPTEPAVLSVTPASLAFSATQGGSSPAAKTLAVSNTGGGSMAWTASENAAWLSVSPGSGTNAGTVTVTPSVTGLSAGTYTTDVTLTAAGATGSPRTVAVTFVVDPPPPVLAVAPASLSFQGVAGASAPAAKTLAVSNTGGGSMPWTATEDAAWLSVAPGSGTNAGTVTASVSLDGLAAGTYTSEVVVSAPSAGSPKHVPVTLVVAAAPTPPALAVAPSALSFSGTQGAASPAAKTLAVSNTGGGTLAWTAEDDAGWLDIAPGSGTGDGTVTVTAQTGALVAGTYTAQVTVRSEGVSGSPRTIPVTFVIAPAPPVLTTAPTSLAFSATQGGASPAAKTFDVAVGALAWSASESVSWLSLTSSAGTVTVTPSITGLTAGTYTTNVTVTAPGATDSPKTVAVTLTVAAPPPVLDVSPAALTFSATVGGSAPAAKTLAVANTGGGALSYTASDDAAWLSVTPASGSAPATLTVTPAISGLGEGTHTATVTVTGASASRTVAVTLTVAAAPATPSGLVAAYGFEETSGTTTVDGSGNGHLGTIAGATSSASGRFGRALSFDGINDWVTVPDANALDLTTGITMSAWINPVAVGSVWRTVLMKEQPGGLIYTLYAGEGSGKPSGHIFTSGESQVSGPSNTPLNAWTHLASTWDGTRLRLFVNGSEVSSQAVSGTLRTSTGTLKIGGNAVWSEWFRGLVDEVRLYNRALSVAEIQGDMSRPVPPTG